MRPARRLLSATVSGLVLALAVGCKGTPAPSVDGTPPLLHDPSAPSAVPVVPEGPCVDVVCETFASADDAVRALVAKDPRVIAFGEAHAQKDGPSGPSTTRRFTERILPIFVGKATDLLLELWVANGACGKKTEAKVQAQQKAVAAPQAANNQNEFVSLGNAAKLLGIRPHVLVPPCEDYARILDAGAGDVDAMLSMIARLTATDMRAFLDKTEGKPSMLVAYGGALHNDVKPRPGHEAWTFGPEMVTRLGAKYMEVDLVVPEAIRDTDAWKSLPWYGKLARERQGDRAVLMTLGPSSYVVFFPPASETRDK